jgi:Zn-dependent peptidase ImmA (M78 family)
MPDDLILVALDARVARWNQGPWLETPTAVGATRSASRAWVPSEAVILLDRNVYYAGRRCTLAHELAHIDFNHIPTQGWFGRRMEHDADALAARRLLQDVLDIADALCVHPLDPEQVAERLGVTVVVLRRRLVALTPAEKDYIERRLAQREDGA